VFAPVDRERPHRKAVESMIEVDEPIAAGRCAGKLERSFDRFGTGVGEKDRIESGIALLSHLR